MRTFAFAFVMVRFLSTLGRRRGKETRCGVAFGDISGGGGRKANGERVEVEIGQLLRQHLTQAAVR